MSSSGPIAMARGGSAGEQAQANQLLQAVNKIASILSGNALSTPYAVQPWITAGDLDLSVAFPTLTAGTVSIRQTVPAAINVTLKPSGPWIIGDGAGVAGADNITVLPPIGYTINGGASDVISTNWQFRIYLLDGTNFVVLSDQ